MAPRAPPPAPHPPSLAILTVLSNPSDHFMAELNTAQYDALERAIADRRRMSVYRRGTEYVVVPTRLRQVEGREALEAVHPTTGEHLTLYIDEVESIEVVD